jgi:hypothetical protein
MPAFAHYIGIDYSGAETPTASLKGLRIYMAERSSPPVEVMPPSSPRKYWTRRGVAEWLVERLAGDTPALVGIDHGFSFPMRYFEKHGLKPDWPTFLDDFQRHWPTDEDIYVDFVRDGAVGNGAARMGDTRWRRLTEEHAGGAKSVFHFDVQGSVAKSTHAGIPWLRFIRQRLGNRVHFWPFDGWDIPAGRSAVAEVYPALWSRRLARADRTDDQHDAYSIATWLSRADRVGSLSAFLRPALTPSERAVAQVEGWILGAAVTHKFTDEDIELVLKSVPNVVDQQRQKLLAKILREWSHIELPDHLLLEPRSIARNRITGIQAVEERASDFLNALDALDEIGRNVIVDQIIRHQKPNSADAKFSRAKQELELVHNFLKRLSSVPSRPIRNLPPRNYAAFFVISDIAEIFEWLTGLKATRRVDREAEGGKQDTGPFWDFAKTIWPLVFRNGTYGLSAAMKNWAAARKHYGERSALIVNIALRNPEWGLFER